MRAVIMAGGAGVRWGDHLGIPKHLIPVDGETLVGRLVRQLAERGIVDIVVLGPTDDERYAVPGAYLTRPSFIECDTDKFLSTVPWWIPWGRTVIVYGDCWLSDVAVDALVQVPRGLGWVGRAGPSALTGCPWGELFGVTVAPEEHGRLAAAIVHVRGILLGGGISRGGGWEVYRATQGLPLDPDAHTIRGDFTDVDDWSDDFDYPEDWERWRTLRRAIR